MTEAEKAILEISRICSQLNLKVVLALGHGGNENGSLETSTFIMGNKSQCNQLMNELDKDLKAIS